MKKKLTLDEMLDRTDATARRKSPRDEEHRVQQACVRWFNLRYPRLRGRLFAVPNGGRRDAVTGARLKAEGVTPGVADLILLRSNRRYGALLVEMKTARGRQSPSQRRWQQLVSENEEYRYVVCRSVDDFRREVEAYLSEEAAG